MSRPIRVAICGASGYGAGELLRLLVQHPGVEVVCVTSTSQVGEPVAAVHPHLLGFYNLRVSERLDYDALLAGEMAVVFIAMPHGASGTAADRVLSDVLGRPDRHKLRVIDLSGDLRLRDAAQHLRYYPESPVLPARRGAFVYGLPEINRGAIRGAPCVANPGCLATAAILAAAPLVCDGFSGLVVVDAKTGSSGSGRQLKDTTHHPTRHADFRAYKPLEHQHEGEILQAWGDPEGERVALSFVAQSMDVTRGVFATVHLTLSSDSNTKALLERFRAYYAGSPFVRLRDESPTLQDVVGSNFCDVYVACRARRVIAMAALDNLVKGMAGAAIQNMNLMCGIEETSGLWTPSLRPM